MIYQILPKDLKEYFPHILPFDVETAERKHLVYGGKKYDKNARKKLIEYMGSQCYSCGYNEDVRALQIDHIYSDASLDARLFGGRSRLYNYYLNHPDEIAISIQILCANCNWIKRYLVGEHGNSRRPKKVVVRTSFRNL